MYRGPRATTSFINFQSEIYVFRGLCDCLANIKHNHSNTKTNIVSTSSPLMFMLITLKQTQATEYFYRIIHSKPYKVLLCIAFVIPFLFPIFDSNFYTRQLPWSQT